MAPGVGDAAAAVRAPVAEAGDSGSSADPAVPLSYDQVWSGGGRVAAAAAPAPARRGSVGGVVKTPPSGGGGRDQLCGRGPSATSTAAPTSPAADRDPLLTSPTCWRLDSPGDGSGRTSDDRRDTVATAGRRHRDLSAVWEVSITVRGHAGGADSCTQRAASAAPRRITSADVTGAHLAVSQLVCSR